MLSQSHLRCLMYCQLLTCQHSKTTVAGKECLAVSDILVRRVVVRRVQDIWVMCCHEPTNCLQGKHTCPVGRPCPLEAQFSKTWTISPGEECWNWLMYHTSYVKSFQHWQHMAVKGNTETALMTYEQLGEPGQVHKRSANLNSFSCTEV